MLYIDHLIHIEADAALASPLPHLYQYEGDIIIETPDTSHGFGLS